MLRTHRIAIAVALTVFAVSPFAMQTAQAKKPTIISSSATATDLTINGEDLAPGAASVLLGSFGPLAVTGQTPTQLVVTLPGGLTPGNYVLSVQVGKGRGDVDESVVTIGAGGLQGPKGETGADGAVGPKGETGADGAVGPKGDTGADGAVGPKGETGADGAVGPKGETGAAGRDGKDGVNGADGLKGDQGERGPKGDQGLPGPAAPMQSGLQFRFTQPNGNGFESSANAWWRAGTFVYQGTSTEKIPTSFIALVYTTNVGSYARVRIQDVVNNATIAMGPPSNVGTNATVAIADLGTISNLPTSPSVFEIQILSTDANGHTGISGRQSVGIHALQMY